MNENSDKKLGASEGITGRQTDRHRWADRLAVRQIDRHTHRQAYEYMKKDTDSQTDRQTHRKIEKMQNSRCVTRSPNIRVFVT